MQISLKSPLQFRLTLAAILLLAIAGPATLNRACAQKAKPAGPPVINNLNNPQPVNAQFQYGTLTATTNSISATYVPITTASGTLTYENLTIPFSLYLDSQGNVQAEAETITSVPAPLPMTDGFVAGNYYGPGSTTAQLITLSGPGVTLNGATEWTVSATPGYTGCPYPFSASFYVGPLEDNPNYPNIESAGITSTAFSYGVEGNQPCSPDNTYIWRTGSILGFSQTGNTLTIVSFDDNGNGDSPTDTIPYTLIIPPS